MRVRPDVDCAMELINLFVIPQNGKWPVPGM